MEAKVSQLLFLECFLSRQSNELLFGFLIFATYLLKPLFIKILFRAGGRRRRKTKRAAATGSVPAILLFSFERIQHIPSV